MAHHASAPPDGTEQLVPQSPVRRVLVLLILTAVAGGATLVIGAMGGLATADDSKPVQPGTPIRNDLLTVELNDARITTGDELGIPELRVGATLVSHHDEPVQAGELMSTIRPKLSPGGLEATGGAVKAERLPEPENDLGDIQPEMPEKTTLTWSLTEPGSDFEEDLENALEPSSGVAKKAARQDKVTVEVTDAEFEEGFTDPRERWFNGDETVGRVELSPKQG